MNKFGCFIWRMDRLSASQPTILCFASEQDLQDLLEQHLHDFLGVHFLKIEFSTDRRLHRYTRHR